jgi:hypothetical protein
MTRDHRPINDPLAAVRDRVAAELSEGRRPWRLVALIVLRRLVTASILVAATYGIVLVVLIAIYRFIQGTAS